MLEKVRYCNYHRNILVETFTDAFVYDRYKQILLLSIVGQDSAVKAISSAMVSGRDLEITRTEGNIAIEADRSTHYKILSSKLPSGLLHQLVVAEDFLKSENSGKKLIFIPAGTNPAEAVFHHLQSTFAITAIPEWSSWLYERLKQQEFLEELEGTEKAVRLWLHEKALDEMISEGAKKGKIRF